MGNKLELALAVLNGAVGDYLVRRGNALATPMCFVHDGEPLPMERDAIAAAYPDGKPKLVVLVHSLMCNETIWGFPNGGDYGAFIARDFAYSPFYLRYNTGLPIPDNGRQFALFLEALVKAYPREVEEILLIGYSMGGLVIRAACHVASTEGSSWLHRVRKSIYVGTPHRGAPAERAGRVLTRVLSSIDDPYTKLAAEIGSLRSAGIKDLGDADLRHEDRMRRTPTLGIRDERHPVPLLPQIEHHLIAGTLSAEPWVADLFGDAVVPLPSAAGHGLASTEGFALPRDHIHVVEGLNHLQIVRSLEVYDYIRAIVEGAP